MHYGNQRRQPTFRRGTAASVRSSPSRRRENPTFHIIPVMILTLILGIIVISWLRSDALKSVVETERRMVAADITMPASLEPRLQPSRLQNEIDALLARNPEFETSIVYTDLIQNRTFEYGSKSSYTAASVGKLITAATYLDDVDKGERSLSDSLQGASARQHIKAMIEVSDNQSWLVLNQLLGYEELEAYASKQGIHNYDSWENTLPAAGINILLQKLYQRELLSPSSTDLLLGHMENANYRQYIVAAIPDESTVYHKVGYLDDRAMDAAIVDNGKYPYVLVIFTEAKSGSYNFTSGTQLIKDITRSVHRVYE